MKGLALPSRVTRSACAAVSVMCLATVTACGAGSNSLESQARAGDAKGYIAGDGTVELIPVARRQPRIALQGTTLEGQSWSLTSNAGKITVLNVWGSWCGPCVAEAPELEKAWQALRRPPDPVVFMGLDFKEGPAAGAAFQRKYRISYSSLMFDGGTPVLALRGQAPAVPTTIVIDRQGRIAARILGQTTASTLIGIVTDVRSQGSRPSSAS